MAGIIARITRSNRERLEKKHAEVSINKCIYDILPFDRCFIKEVTKIYQIESRQFKSTPDQNNHLILTKRRINCFELEQILTDALLLNYLIYL